MMTLYRDCRLLPAGPATHATLAGPGAAPADPGAPASTGDAPVARAAFLVDGAIVVWVGPLARAPEPADLGPARVRVVDLQGAVVTAGLVDAHVHLGQTGSAMAGVDLAAARSVAGILGLVEAATRSGGGRPVLGHGWDERALAEGRPPTRRELDRAGAGGLVYLSRIDLHSAVVSSALAAAAGLAELPGWSPDGLVSREAHHGALAAARAGRSAGDARAAQLRALRAAAAAGITCVHEMSPEPLGDEAELAGLLDLADDPTVTLPEVVAYRGVLVADVHAAQEVAARFGGRLAGLGGDLYVDGSIGSHTAAFADPYSDAPGEHGRLYLDAAAVRDHVTACTRAGLQAGFHVIGDAGIAVALEGVRRAAERVGIAAVRRAGHRFEHVEAADARAVAELADLGLTASVQPAFDAAWGGADGMYAARLGPARALATNPFAGLAAAGVKLALGSDSPVTPFDPWAAVAACADHHEPGQRLSGSVALDAHTRGGRAAGRAAGSPTRPGPGSPPGTTPAGYPLAVGGPATFAVWSAAGWSAQTGSPGSPDAGSAGAADRDPDPVAAFARLRPVCLHTVRDGNVLHDATGEPDPAQPGAGSSSSAGRSL